MLTTWWQILKLSSWIRPLICLYILSYNYNKRILERAKKNGLGFFHLYHIFEDSGMEKKYLIFSILYCADCLQMGILWFSMNANLKVQPQRRPFDHLTQIRVNYSILHTVVFRCIKIYIYLVGTF